MAVAALVAASVVDPASASAASAPLTRTDYDSIAAGAESYSYWAEQVKAPDRVSYVADPAGQRGIVQRIEVKPGDNYVFETGGSGERAEVTRVGDLGGFVDGQTIVMSWGLFIDSAFASPPGDWNNFVQLHVAGGSGQSPWQLNLVGDGANLKMRLFGGGQLNGADHPPGSTSEWFTLGSLPKQQWHDFVIEVRLGCTGTGYAKIWRDGQKLVDAQNRKIGYCGDPGLYWKQGFYRVAYDKATRVWFSDTFRWATTTDAFANYGWDPRAL
ncbi:heparin lyase I family protein [Mycolicibacterium helvum]